ncbi:MAG: VTT domain-containing protein [Pseudomonadota bacterium]
MAETVSVMMAEASWAVYLGLLVAPFIQEDAAVIGAASLAAAEPQSAPLILAIALLGLSVSDLWKYAIGLAAQRQAWAQRLATKPAVQKAGEAVRRRLGSAIMTARFLPGTRIALYIAAGYFSAPFPRFAFFIVLSGAVLLVGLYAVFAVLGDLVGDRAALYVGAAAIGGVVLWLLAQAVRPQFVRS